jgi:hypothetical protein
MAEVNKWVGALKAVFDSMGAGPKKLLPRLKLEAGEQGLKGEAADVLAAALKDKDDPIREELHAKLSAWDYDAKASWAKTAPNTEERRSEIYELLEVPENLRKALDKHVPPMTQEVEREVLIAQPGATDWYTVDFRRGREFYWPRYRAYLKDKKGFSVATLDALHESSNRVIESVAPPHSAKADARRGLVVGYVQSGKTTNFTAVIAKAIDAGYRLIIVLAGTIDLLRLQTQRRLDMELVGVENLNIDPDDPEREYQDDSAFPSKFATYGGLPRTLGAPNIKRLTSSDGDFRSLHASFQALAFDELNGTEKAFLPDSIKKTNVRLIVIKKVTPRLKKLVHEVKQNKLIREHLPTLIIDDESDQASVNTVKPNPAAREARSKTNGYITDLLTLLPRAQYVGYTATPFANVLVDATDAEGLYPRDFIISLPRPAGYMGVRDFHDIDRPDDLTPNKDAFVRQFDEAKAEESLKDAIDTFVVTGAIKLFRKSKGVAGDFRHHTMMVHETVLNDDQFEQKRRLLTLWKQAGYGSTGAGPARLKAALDQVRVVSKKQAPDLPFPADYQELKAFVAEALKLIATPEPVIVVNGDDAGTDPEFDTTDNVWKIIVGGAKLSRGFTVEGLTITHFARRSKAQDTMMQMGRWFGYRGGYRDLVRLYLEKGDDERFDLYDAFESICRDEEAFRAQLSQYSKPDAKGRRIRPIELPAVVYNSFPGMMPAARNKMFNAILREAALNDEWREKTDVPDNDAALKTNWGLLGTLVGKNLKPITLAKQDFLVAHVKREEVVAFLKDLKWRDDRVILVAEREFIASNKSAAKSWAVLFPLLEERGAVKLGSQPLSIHMRSRRNGTFKAFSGMQQREAARAASLAGTGEFAGKGLLLVYPTYPKDEAPPKAPVVGFGLYHPPIPASEVKVVFTVRDPSHANAVVVSK